ncbi:MAG: ABC transporter permease [Rhodospirillaceae bacterium]
MFRNYLAAALRNLVRNRLYAAINIVGLAVGFTAALLIALFVRDEFSYDKWLPGHERTYLIYERYAQPGRAPISINVTFSDVAKLLPPEFPDIETVTRLESANLKLRHGDVEAAEGNTFWADPNFFDVLPFKAIAGDLKTALRQPDGVVLTRTLARKYFGRDTPIGESLELDRKHVLQVRAVIEDLPSNTHLAIGAIASGLAPFSGIARQDANATGGKVVQGENDYTYVRLRSGASIQALRAGMPSFVERHGQQLFADVLDPSLLTFSFVPLAEIHFHAPSVTDRKPPSDMGAVVAIMAVGALILFIAGINFINLMTARSLRGAVEVGVRKALGARRVDLIVQFIGGAAIHVALSMLLAGIAAALLLPSFNGFLDRMIAVDLLRNPGIILAGLVLTAVVALLAGFYPSLVLSSFRPAFALRDAGRQGAGASPLRQILVVLQFAILTGLVLATTVIYRQTAFATRERLRFGNAQVLQIATDCRAAFADEVRQIAGVDAAACSSASALQYGRVGTEASVVGDRATLHPNLRVNPANPEFFDLFGLRFLAGHAYAPEALSSAPDETAKRGPAVVLNETALRALGFPSAEAAVGRILAWKRFLNGFNEMSPQIESPIVGVVSDFSLGTVRDAIEPSLYYYEPQFNVALNVKIRDGAVPEVMKAVADLWRRGGERAPLDFIFLDQRIQELYRDIQRQGAVFGVFAVVAIFIAGLGLLGLSAFTAESRTKEIGIRKAMGASRTDVLRLVLWQFTKPVLWANLIAWPVAYFIMRRWLESFAYHIDLSPWMFLAASALALVIAVLTVSGHALLVARSQPVKALRYE